MNILITGKNVIITEGMRDRITKQISKCEKYLKDNTKVNVLVRTVKEDQIIEVTIPMGKKKTIRVEKRDSDLYEAINMAEEVLMRKLRKEKEKSIDKKRVAERVTKKPETEPEHSIKKQKVFELAMMTPEDAVLEMESLDHDFHVFMNIEDGRVGVIYKRKECGYGLLSAEF
jgi:putative sigma-54 modulation protein